MDRLTERALRIPKELIDNSMPVDCRVYCQNHVGGCKDCVIERSFEKLADYEDAEEREPTRTIETREIADFYNYESQSRQCIEECAELIQAINKVWREMEKENTFRQVYADGPKRSDSEEVKKALEHVYDEMADVQIMLWQMERKLDCRKDVEDAIDAKLLRQVNRIDEYETGLGVMTTIKSRIAFDKMLGEGEQQNRGG